MGKFEFQEERPVKFDARLRYVENLLSVWIIFIQLEAQRRRQTLTPPQKREWEAKLLEIYFILKLHYPGLKAPDFNNIDKYVDDLISHEEIKLLTENKTKNKDPGKAVYERF